MNKDTIYRQAAINAVHEEFDDCLVWDESGQRTADEFETIINRLPSAQPERKRGKWIPKRDCRYHCSLCDGIAPKGYRWNYCPNCGADMREEEQDES